MNIEKFCKIYNLGQVEKITQIFGGLMHKMYKVETDKSVYCVKILNPEIMKREEAYNNFIISESVSNLAKKNGIPVSSALEINGEYLKELDGYYYMIFDFIEGKTLKDDEITIEHCKKIGKELANIHMLNYKEIGLIPNTVKYKKIYDWKSYINNPNFDKMSYKEMFLRNYRKFNSILKRANERFNESNNNQTLCHSDMDPKNVIWNNDNPIIIDWECAGMANPERELLETALCWSGFLSNNFSKEKFITMIKEYSKYRSIINIEWFNIICGNLIGRFNWLKYNLERSLGIVSDKIEEMKLAENEVTKTIDEINRYLELIGTMNDSINKIITEGNKKYDSIIQRIIDGNELLKGEKFELITAGFTNTSYLVKDYVVKICTNLNNEKRFINEINFYNENKYCQGIAKLFLGDTTKKVVPYYYEIIEKVSGKNLYELWYKLSDIEREKILIQIIGILKQFHLKDANGYDFSEKLKKELLYLKKECNLSEDLFNDLIGICYKYFKENKFGLIHGDLHFDNFIFNGTDLYLLDFEKCMIAPIDYDFKIFSIYDSKPYLWASYESDMLTVESDYEGFMNLLLENYEELRKIPFINERLEFYSIIELLKNYKKTKNEEIIDEVYSKIKRLKER